LDFVKSLYAKFIDWDEDMYDLENDTPAHAAKSTTKGVVWRLAFFSCKW